MKNKTAVDEIFKIIEGLIEYSPNNPLLEQLMAAKPRLKELEKQQIINASNDSYLNGELIKRSVNNKKVSSVGQQYYNETYGGNQ